ncbi:MAG TPA: hypothetical protein VI248_26890 [Kineosporiaceae bacterium]
MPGGSASLTEVHKVIDAGQARMDADPHRAARLARLAAECRRHLDVEPMS